MVLDLVFNRDGWTLVQNKLQVMMTVEKENIVYEIMSSLSETS